MPTASVRRTGSLTHRGDKPWNEEQATAVAEALGGTAWQSGGGIWLVLFDAGDGRFVAASEDLV